MIQLQTEIQIRASAQTIWEILTDLPRYSDWNPLIPRAKGNVREGGKLEVFIDPPGLRGSLHRLTVLEVACKRKLRWLGRFGLPKIMDGDHLFILETQGPDMTRVVQAETFTGVLVPVLSPWLKRNMRAGFEALNRALKEEAESRTRQSGPSQGPRKRTAAHPTKAAHVDEAKNYG